MITQDLIKETLEKILKALEAGEVERHDSYGRLFPDEFGDHLDDRYSDEHVLAKEAIKHPELHPLMEKLVLKITEIGERGNHTQIWENEETQAGGSLARELAMYDKKYLPLQLRYIYTNDMDHEVNQMDDIVEICDKWDYSKEICPLLIFRAEFGQVTEAYDGLASGILKREEDAQGYMDEAVIYFKENWTFTEDDENDIEQINMFFTPVFGTFYGLTEDEMESFATEFVNLMAAEEDVTIEALVKAARNE